MKMITKTFQKRRYAFMAEIGVPVQAALATGLNFDVDGNMCRLKGLNVDLCCKTPDDLYAAWLDGKAITFSVTLPARCWK